MKAVSHKLRGPRDRHHTDGLNGSEQVIRRGRLVSLPVTLGVVQRALKIYYFLAAGSFTLASSKKG